jgi:formylglycine-generating enzyme required for sulfatase activity
MHHGGALTIAGITAVLGEKIAYAAAAPEAIMQMCQTSHLASISNSHIIYQGAVKQMILMKVRTAALLIAGASIIGTSSFAVIHAQQQARATHSTTLAAGEQTPPSGLAPGATRINPKDGAVMVWVPAGEFTMGTDLSDIPETAQMPPAPPWGWKDDDPIVNITFFDAAAYADWAGVWLPTEAQWEKAARGTDGRAYPWGNDWDGSRCVHSDTLNPELASTKPVGSCPSGASPYGCMDMAGNVSQWCADWYDENYYKSAPAHDPTGPASGTLRVLRGENREFNNPSDFRVAMRIRGAPAAWNDYVGFRCVAAPGSD